MDKLKIILSPGHGPKENPYPHQDTTEGKQTYYLAKAIEKELKTLPGVEIINLRPNISDNPSYVTRGQLKKGDIYFAIHTDAHSDPKASGVTIFDSIISPSQVLGDGLGRAIAKAMGIRYRGFVYRDYSDNWSWDYTYKRLQRKDYFAELRNNHTKHRFLIEHGFHTNKSDSKKITDPDVKIRIAKAYKAIIAQYFKITPKGQKIFSVQAGAFKSKANADVKSKALKELGFDSYIYKEDNLYKVQIAACLKLNEAQKIARIAKAKGVKTYIREKNRG